MGGLQGGLNSTDVLQPRKTLLPALHKALHDQRTIHGTKKQGTRGFGYQICWMVDWVYWKRLRLRDGEDMYIRASGL